MKRSLTYVQQSFDYLFARCQHSKVVHRIIVVKKMVHGPKKVVTTELHHVTNSFVSKLMAMLYVLAGYLEKQHCIYQTLCCTLFTNSYATEIMVVVFTVFTLS